MILAVIAGLVAGCGAVARYALDQAIQHRHDSVFPRGTAAVNVLGSLLLGLVTGLAVHHGLPDGPTVVLSAGFCSGFTTWSTFSYETVALLEARALPAAAVNFFGSVAVGIAAAGAGYGLTLL